MHWYSRFLAAASFLTLIPVTSFAQADLCVAPLPSVPNEAKAEQLRIQAQERKDREFERRAWEVKMVAVKNEISDRNLQALCIFRIEVVSQPALRLVQIRAPKELMSAIEDALKRLDVPPPPPLVRKMVELTGYVLIVADTAEPGLMPLPSSLESVGNQLKSLLPNGNLYLADTIVARGSDRVSVRGSTTLDTSLTVRDGAPPVIALTNFSVQASGAQFTTTVDIPIGVQVVVGKATTTGDRKRAVVLVMTAKLIE